MYRATHSAYTKRRLLPANQTIVPSINWQFKLAQKSAKSTNKLAKTFSFNENSQGKQFKKYAYKIQKDCLLALENDRLSKGPKDDQRYKEKWLSVEDIN